MVEGAGFLQWLSVYALATDPTISTLLLDEPDAHLHSSLQGQLLEKLEEIAQRTGKQVLVATHSSEILKNSRPSKILHVSSAGDPKFLSTEPQKVGLLAGLGSDYSPRIDGIRKSRRLLFLEGKLDGYILRKAAELSGIEWPAAWVEWKSAAGHKERKQLFIALSEEVEGLVAVSLRDRDDEPLNSVAEHLEDRGHTSLPDGFYCMKWRRRHIESYLTWPPAMAAGSGMPEPEIRQLLQERFAIAVGGNFCDAHPPAALLDLRGKDVLASLAINAHDVIDNMQAEHLPDDLRIFVQQLVELT